MIWQKRNSPGSELQLLVPKPAREQLFLAYHASLFGGHLGRNRTLARLSHRFYWSGMSDDVKDWLGQCTVCMKRKSPTGRHHPLGNIPTGHCWDRIAMDISTRWLSLHISHRRLLQQMDRGFSHQEQMCGHGSGRIGGQDYSTVWHAFVIHSDQGREYENGLMKSLCTLLGCVNTRTAPNNQSHLFDDAVDVCQ